MNFRVVRFQKLAPPEEPIRGAGDLVAKVARPVARVIDAALGTDLENCGGCEGRKEWLNKALKFRRKA